MQVGKLPLGALVEIEAVAVVGDFITELVSNYQADTKAGSW